MQRNLLRGYGALYLYRGSGAIYGCIGFRDQDFPHLGVPFGGPYSGDYNIFGVHIGGPPIYGDYQSDSRTFSVAMYCPLPDKATLSPIRVRA